MKHQIEKIKGRIRTLSTSPHGDPEGLVLEDGTFVKIPPHSLLHKNRLTVGTLIEGTAELIAAKPHLIYHHARVSVGGQVVADDQGKPHEKEHLKETHKQEVHEMKKTQARPAFRKVRSKVAAVGLKPKGEVDRLILEDGTSVHIPKEMELTADDFQIGSEVQIEGEGQVFAVGPFLRAHRIRNGSGQVMDAADSFSSNPGL